MSDEMAAKKNLKPLGIFRGFAVAGVEPDEMGIGPALAVPRLLKRHNLNVADIDLWELNEAFACQVLYCMDKLGIPHDKLNVEWRRHLHRPSLWHVGRAHERAICCWKAAGAAPRSAWSPCASAAAWARRACSRSFR